jgi:hypothetical protein
LEIEKSSSQLFFLSLMALMRALYCKNDLVSSQNALSTKDLIFISSLGVLANSAMRFRISAINVTNWLIVRPQISNQAEQKVEQPENLLPNFGRFCKERAERDLIFSSAPEFFRYWFATLSVIALAVGGCVGY